jgi:choloylglycine hydrolase
MLSKEGPPIVAKSYDWSHEDGIVHRNPKGLKKQGLLLSQTEKPLEWTSQHGSLTFNQYGREMPNGGMNDAGLVVEIMWLNTAEWPAPDARPALNELQWIQYQLDMHATTREAVAGAKRIRVAPIHGEVHYMVCDASSECASFEYLQGELVIHQGEFMPIPVLTNHTYEQSTDHMQSPAHASSCKGTGSLSRFHRAAETTERASSLAAAWEGLEAVQWQRTQWQIVYEPDRLMVHFKTRGNREIRSISLQSIPSSCETPVQVLSMQAPLSGDVASSFADFDPVANKSLVQTSVRRLDSGLPPSVVDSVADFSSYMRCAN